jgi:membrane protein DedA with SNARE-associated domain
VSPAALPPPPRPPWTARLRALPAPDLLLAAALLATLVLGAVMSTLTPSLLAHHVVLLEALSGGILPLVVGGAQARVHAVPVLDVALWGAGRRWGPTLVDRLGRVGRRRSTARPSSAVLELARRRGVLVLSVAYYQPVPNALLYAACGAAGMGVGTFLLGDAIGTLLWEALVVSLGWAFGRRAVSTVDAVDRHAVVVTVAVVVLVMAVRAARSRAAGRRRRPDPATGPALRRRRTPRGAGR